jgi:hypothetical protein
MTGEKNKLRNQFITGQMVAMTALMLAAISVDLNMYNHQYWKALIFTGVLLIDLVCLIINTRLKKSIEKRMDYVDITKPALKYNYDALVNYTIEKKFASVCPCCGEDNQRSYYTKKGYFGDPYFEKRIVRVCYENEYEGEHRYNFNDKSPFAFILSRCKKHQWWVKSFECMTCGAEWKTPAYPAKNLDLSEIEYLFNYIDWREAINDYEQFIDNNRDRVVDKYRTDNSSSTKSVLY